MPLGGLERALEVVEDREELLDEPLVSVRDQALLTQPGEGAEEGAVLQVLQKGYKLGERVLRPARVIVAQVDGD